MPEREREEREISPSQTPVESTLPEKKSLSCWDPTHPPVFSLSSTQRTCSRPALSLAHSILSSALPFSPPSGSHPSQSSKCPPASDFPWPFWALGIHCSMEVFGLLSQVVPRAFAPRITGSRRWKRLQPSSQDILVSACMPPKMGCSLSVPKNPFYCLAAEYFRKFFLTRSNSTMWTWFCPLGYTDKHCMPSTG